MPRAVPPLPTRILLVGAAAATGLLASGCGSDPDAHNAADVAYASHLISHHAQTLQILDRALGREEVSDEAGALADRTRKQRYAEVDAASTWLKSWGEPIPETALEHTHSTEPLQYDTRIPGVMSHEELLGLEKRKPATFERSWLQSLIRHEQGAAELAAEAAANAASEQVVAAAKKDEARHRRQVERLRALLLDALVPSR